MFQMRFRLRSLLLISAILPLLIGALSSRIFHNEILVRRIAEIGGNIKYDYEQMNRSSLSRWFLRVDSLAGGNHIISISLTNKHNISGIMRSLSTCSRLQGLYLGDSTLENDDLASIGNLQSLKKLELTGSTISDDGLRHLATLTNLEYLGLGDCDVTDLGMNHLSTLDNLRELSLDGTNVGDEGVTALSRLSKLRVLRLEGTRITDRGAENLTKSVAVEFLIVSNTALTEKGISSLANMKSLRLLDVSGIRCPRRHLEEVAVKYFPKNVSVDIGQEGVSSFDMEQRILEIKAAIRAKESGNK